MRTPIFIDSCAWNYLFERHVAIEQVFPPEEFQIFQTREVQIEISEMPDIGIDGSDKRLLKRYIQESRDANSVRTTGTFGFATFEADGTPSKNQVRVGFGQGGFQSNEHRSWYATKEVRSHLDGKSKRKSGLGRNQADASMAVRSFDSIILTNEKNDKSGPLRLAAEQSGHVVYLQDLDETRTSLKEFVQEARERWLAARQSAGACSQAG